MGELGSRQDNEFKSFVLDIDTNVTRRVTQSLTANDLISIAINSQVIAGTSYDEVVASLNGANNTLLTFNLVGACQTQVLITFISGTNWTIINRGCIADLVQEDGFDILQENGDKLLAEGMF